MAAKEKSTIADAGEKAGVSLTEPKAKQEPQKQAESLYTVEELSANAIRLFGVRAECVAAALKAAGIKECTVSKTKEIVKAFMEREVK